MTNRRTYTEAEVGALLSCPFCGSQSVGVRPASVSGAQFWVFCDDCTATGQWEYTAEKAIASWNRRAPVTALVEAVGREAAATARRIADEEQAIAAQSTDPISRHWASYGASRVAEALADENAALRTERDKWQAAAVATEAMIKARGTNRDYWESRAEHAETDRDAATARAAALAAALREAREHIMEERRSLVECDTIPDANEWRDESAMDDLTKEAVAEIDALFALIDAALASVAPKGGEA